MVFPEIEKERIFFRFGSLRHLTQKMLSCFRLALVMTSPCGRDLVLSEDGVGQAGLVPVDVVLVEDVHATPAAEFHHEVWVNAPC